MNVPARRAFGKRSALAPVSGSPADIACQQGHCEPGRSPLGEAGLSARGRGRVGHGRLRRRRGSIDGGGPPPIERADREGRILPERHARGPDLPTSKADALDDAPIMESRGLRIVDGASNAVERSGVQRDAAESLQAVADPVAAELETALALRLSGADPKVLRRALRRIEELLGRIVGPRPDARGGGGAGVTGWRGGGATPGVADRCGGADGPGPVRSAPPDGSSARSPTRCRSSD